MDIKTRLKEFYRVRVRDTQDQFMFMCALLLITTAIVIVVYDVATIIAGTVNANIHLPFVYAIGLAAIGAIVILAL